MPFYAFTKKTPLDVDRMLELIGDRERKELRAAEEAFEESGTCVACRIAFRMPKKEKDIGLVKVIIYLLLEKAQPIDLGDYYDSFRESLLFFFKDTLKVNDCQWLEVADKIVDPRTRGRPTVVSFSDPFYVMKKLLSLKRCSPTRGQTIRDIRDLEDDTPAHIAMPLEIVDRMNPFAKCPRCNVTDNDYEVIADLFSDYDDLMSLQSMARVRLETATCVDMLTPPLSRCEVAYIAIVSPLFSPRLPQTWEKAEREIARRLPCVEEVHMSTEDGVSVRLVVRVNAEDEEKLDDCFKVYAFSSEPFSHALQYAIMEAIWLACGVPVDYVDNDNDDSDVHVLAD